MKIAHPRSNTDCIASALATILEIPIEDVPEFYNEKVTATQQYENVRKWLARHGYHYYYSECHPRQFAEFQQQTFKRGESWPPRGYWLGRITRVEWLVDDMPGHVVVMKGFKCVFNPSGTVKATKDNDVFLTGYYLLVPLDPSM